MALTEQERDIARQIKEQWGTKQDFIDILWQIRSKQPKQEIQQAPEPVEVQWWTPTFFTADEAPVTQAQPTLTLGKLQDIASKEQEIEQEKEEGLKWFITETWEALKERWKTAWEIIQRKLKEWWEALWKATQAFAKWDNKKAVWNLFKDQLNAVWGGTLQLWWQLVWGGWDIVWETLENTIQDATPEVVEDTIEKAVSWIANTNTVQAIAKSYWEFRENNPESARNIEASINIAEILPFFKWGRKTIWAVAKAPVTATAKVATAPIKITAKTIRGVTPNKIANKIAWISPDTASVIKKTPKKELQNILKQAQKSVDNIWKEQSPFAIAWEKASKSLEKKQVKYSEQ